MDSAIASSTKSVITCDLEGRIETYNAGAEELFGYPAKEVIGKKRVSLFSPGQVVLQHVPTWLKIASEKGEYETDTVFVRRDGTPVAAHIRITPTFKAGQQIGFCGVTEPLTDVSPEQVAPQISTFTRVFTWLVITRAPFLTAIIVPVLAGAAWVSYAGLVTPFPWLLFVLTLLAGISMHIAANTFNDYFDWKSGTDQLNNSYFLPYSGGSRSIELGLITEKALFRVALVALLISGGLGITLAYLSSPWVLLIGALGAFFSYFYTAPPLRLAARYGLGELSIFLNFGPLPTLGAVVAMTGILSWDAALVGIPIGLLTTAILWINQFPDEEGDRAAGKNNLVVVLGKANARWGYVLLLAVAFILPLYWIWSGLFPLTALLVLLALPMAINATRILMRDYEKRSLVKANATTINLQLVFGLLLAIGLFLGPLLDR
jgi:1,4-dihydroxy-2-naphthoate octaprenyltransferase